MKIAAKHLSNRRSDPGFVLVATLLAVALISVLALVIARAAFDAGQTAKVFADREHLELIATGVRDQTLADLLRGETSALTTHTVRTLQPSERIAASVRAESSAGLINLNTAPESLLARLFAWAGAPDPNMLAARVADWRDRDDQARPNGLEAEGYQAAGLTGPANRAFVDRRELRLIPGLSDESVSLVLPLVTVHGRQRLDPDYAPDAIKQMLAEIPREDRRRLIQPAASPLEAAVVITATLTHQSGSQLVLRSVVRILPGREPPYLLLDHSLASASPALGPGHQ